MRRLKKTSQKALKESRSYKLEKLDIFIDENLDEYN